MLSYSSPCVHTKKISSMYLNRTRGCNCYASRKLVSNLPMKRHAYGGADLLPIAVPETWYLVLLLKPKKLFFSTNSAILTESSAGIDFLSCLSKTS